MDTNVNEIWLPVPNYEGLYEVSNLGNVKTLSRTVQRCGIENHQINERLLKQNKNKQGYLSVTLSRSKKVKVLRINRLVAMAFLPNPENKETVNHINCIKSDNTVWNLEWATRSENEHHALINGRKLKGEENGFSKLKTPEIIEIRRMFKDKISTYKIAETFNISQSTAYDIASGKRWKHIS